MTAFSRYVFLALVLSIHCVVSARDVTIQTIPQGASLKIVNLGSTRIDGGALFKSPAIIDFRSRTEPYRIEVSLPDYQTETFVYDYRNNRTTGFTIELDKLVDSRSMTFSSDPVGAEILIDGDLVGVTPLMSKVRFERSSADGQWSRHSVEVRKHDYAGTRFELNFRSPDILPTVELDLIREVKTFELNTSSSGLPLSDASIYLNDEPLLKDGKLLLSPAKFDLEFTRDDVDSEWTEHKLRSEIEDEFEPSSVVVRRDSPSELTLDLEPVTEVPVIRYFPTTEITARGPRLGLDKSAPLGMLDSRDQMGNYSEIRRITDYKRGSQSLESVNSFAIAPDGQRVIYSLTRQHENGSYFANLFMKAANAQSFSVQQLTRGSQFYEINPTMSSDPESQHVIFQSNRLGRRDSWDISAIRVQQGRILGGVVQVTHEPRFNYSPSLVHENRPLFFIGYENFSSARPYISSVRIDGSSYTVLPQEAEDVAGTQAGEVYFVQKTHDPDVKQIFSIDVETSQISTVINTLGYTESNCFDPSISPDGSRMLFVSDYVRDEKDRPNNNIFIFNFETGNVQLVTDNGSDDIKPVWSPTEPNVVYFLSNREGAYNIWRMVLTE